MLGEGKAQNNLPLAASGAAFIIIGSILDGKDSQFPEHMEALNPIPRDAELAQELGVSFDEITDYNSHLNEVRSVALELAQDLHTLISQIRSAGVTHKAQLSANADLKAFGAKYGFETLSALEEAFQAPALSRDTLERFAHQTGLSVSQTKILLRSGFGLRSA